MMAATPVPDPDFEALLGYIQESRALDFRGYKRTSLRRRIGLRMEAVGSDDFAAYRSHLEAQPSEFEDLLNTVLINVTSFFRDADAWEVLKSQVIPAILAKGDGDRPIRVWSIGCASGEEPYSIAMLLADALGNVEFCRRVKIYATDLDEEALKVARLATYTPRDVEGVPAGYLDRFFERTNNHYVFERELRKCVIFGRHNVVHDAPISRIDLLVCRNLLIYLESDTQAVVLPRLHYALNPDGFLFLGKAETQLARSSLFRPIEMKHRIFAKVPQEWRRSVGSSFGSGRIGRPDAQQIDARLLDAVINESGAALLVVDQSGAVSLANTAARQLLGVGEADLGRPFQDLPISYRPMELRGPIEEVFRQRRGLRLDDQEYRVTQNELMRLTIDIRPLQRVDGGVYAVLLTFQDQTRLHNLQRELEAAQENLEQSIEELQSANEELETTNEELQSTNEELETLNEEARSSNEEMESVNEELRIQAEQAAGYRLHLESVLRTMNGGIIVLDHKHTIQSWNRWCENTWGLRAEEVIGTNFDALDIGAPIHKLRETLADVQTGRHEHAEHQLEGIDRRGRRILCRVQVSGLLDEGGGSHGLVLVFQDITEERAREDYVHFLGRIMSRAATEVYILDPGSLRITFSSRAAQARRGFSAQQMNQMSLADLLTDISADDLRGLIAPLAGAAEPEITLHTALRQADGSTEPVELCVQHFSDETPPVVIAFAHAPRRSATPPDPR